MTPFEVESARAALEQLRIAETHLGAAWDLFLDAGLDVTAEHVQETIRNVRDLNNRTWRGLETV